MHLSTHNKCKIIAYLNIFSIHISTSTHNAIYKTALLSYSPPKKKQNPNRWIFPCFPVLKSWALKTSRERPRRMAETKRRVTPSFPPPAMDKITSKRPPATSTASNLKAKIWPSFCWCQLCFGGRDLFGTNGCGVTRFFWSVFVRRTCFSFLANGKKRTWNKKHDVSWTSCVYSIHVIFIRFPI